MEKKLFPPITNSKTKSFDRFLHHKRAKLPNLSSLLLSEMKTDWKVIFFKLFQSVENFPKKKENEEKLFIVQPDLKNDEIIFGASNLIKFAYMSQHLVFLQRERRENLFADNCKVLSLNTRKAFAPSSLNASTSPLSKLRNNLIN
jgi:hypothetical protein